MDERQLKFRVGVVVVAAAIITIILITLLGAWPSPFKSRYTVQIEFPSAPGVTIDTPVRKSGIQVGRVAGMELLDNGRVLLTVNIDSQYRLRTDQVCRISSGSLVTGDAILEWIRSDTAPEGPDEFIAEGDYLTNGQVATDPFKAIANLEEKIDLALTSIRDSSTSLGKAGEEVEKLAGGVNKILGSKEGELESLVDQALAALRNFNTIMTDLQDITGDPTIKEKLRGTLDQLPDLFAEAQKTLGEVQNTLQQFNTVAVRAERNLANLEDFTAPLGERGEEISQNLVDSIRSVNELLTNLANLTQALSDDGGTIGQLITNPELYERVNRTVMEIERLVRKVEPILDDIRVVSDKVARDPAQMGVKGILDRRPLGAGQKYPTDLPPTPPRSGLHLR